ncbi:MAG: glycosyltransferase [Gemmatimonadota bacterium]
MDRPELTVIVTIVEGGAALRRCLTALAAQADAPSMEVLVPYDSNLPGVEEQVQGWKGVRALAMGTIPVSARHEGGQHELYDRRRAHGLRHAQGAHVALIEDRSVPRPDWARQLVSAHRRSPVGALGGAVEPRVEGLLGWAVYFCDYGRYQLPFAAGPRAHVSDVNVSYARPILESTRSLWEERYHETVVHWAVQQEGQPLVLDPSVVVEHGRVHIGLRAAVAERFHWGRVFGYTRSRTDSGFSRLVHAAAAPVLPLVVWTRLLVQRLQRRGRSLGRFLAATPAILVFLVAWAAGEATGTVTGRSV